MCCSINVYVDGCCVQRLSVGNGEGSIGELKEELSRSLDPLVLQAKLEEEEGCVAPPLDTVDQAETDGAPATFLALLCSFGMLARGVATHVETSACMEGSPAGLLAEAGRSLGQPAACFFQYAVRSLCSASSPWAELGIPNWLRVAACIPTQAALFDSVEVAALWDSLEITTIS